MIISPPVVLHTGLVKAIGNEKDILQNKSTKLSDGKVDLQVKADLFEERKALTDVRTNTDSFENMFAQSSRDK